jgi:Concanavalin A-like lectin/glucanases superfamily/Abnormal spindle-like microcephaly-assoc'd, ASPM-SPD-2-Hydin
LVSILLIKRPHRLTNYKINIGTKVLMRISGLRVFIFTGLLFTGCLNGIFGINAAAATPGLVAAYGFNEGSGAVISDSSGSGNKGTASNTSWSSNGKFGAALSFNGTNSWVTIPDSASLDLTNGMTLEGWVNPTILGTSSNSWRTVVIKEQPGGLIYALYANTDSVTPSGHVFTTREYDTRGTATIPTRSWTHLATTYDGTQLRFFVNGVEISRRTVAGSLKSSSGVLRIGGNGIWPEFFNGLIDEVRIYNRPLTASEIKTDMNTPISGSTTPAVAVSISPTSTSLQPGGVRQFAASVTGTTNTAVTWSASGGSISSSGLYTAPATTGTYTVRATSVADTTKYSTATITVTPTTTYQLSVAPTSVSFGGVVVGNTLSKTVTLSNTGSGSVQVSAANFTGGVFRASGLTLPFTMAAGSTKTVTIVFQPDTSGPFSGSVSFVSNATNSPATATFSGSGTAAAPHSVDLNWNPSTSTVTGYFVYRGTASAGPFAKLNSSSLPSTSFTDSSVQSGQMYYYAVTAVDSAGRESAYSNTASAQIPTP